MVKTSQHLADAGCRVKLKLCYFYVWLIISGFTGEIFCAETANGKQIEAQNISTSSSSDDTSDALSFTEESSVAAYNGQKSDQSYLYRHSRSVPRDKSESSSQNKPKNYRKHDYVLKIPLSLLRQYELYRLLKWQEHGENGDYEKRQTVIPGPRFGRANDENEFDGNIFQTFNSEQDHFSEDYLDEIFKEETDNTSPLIRNSRSMLLLSAPKSEEPIKEKPTQTFVLPYPRPGRSAKNAKVGKSNHDHQKYILPTARVGRSSLHPVFVNEEDSLVIDDWLSGANFNTLSEKLNKEISSEKSLDENEGNSFFVIPYPRPGKRTMFKLRNRNQESKNLDKEASDYVLPYPRPGKKSGKGKFSEILSSKSKETKNTDSPNFILPYPRPGRANENYFYSPSKEFEIFTLPYMNTAKNVHNIVPYPRPVLSASQDNEDSELFYSGLEANSGEFQISPMNLKNLEDVTPDIFRFKRSSSVVPYPRLGRSNVVVPYPRPGRSNVVIPYPRPGRSNSVVPYPRIGRSDAVVPYPRPGRSGSIVPYPRPGRSESVVPYPRPGRAEFVVPYPRPGRAEYGVPYPRPGRAESLVPYPRPGRAESVVPYPRPGRAESLVPYPRPGRAESIVPYPRPGRAESIVPYPRPGRAVSVLPYPRPGRAESVVPYPRLGTSNISKKGSQRSVDKDAFGYTDTNSGSLRDINTQFVRRADGQGYVLPHPRIGRSDSQKRKKRESLDTDTIIPYPRLGRSEKETFPKEPPENQNSLHKLNKHMLTNSENSIYLLPYPRPGRYLK